MQYIIMRKNTPLTVADFAEDGRMLWYSREIKNEHLAPLQEKTAANWLVKWWDERSVPLGQNKIKEMLNEKNLIGPEEYLLKNLGLSLTDYYWIKPIDSNLRWEDVNLFQNDFQNEIKIEKIKDIANEEVSRYNPNSSLQGQLEKKWVIHEGYRFLVKGNRDMSSAESINEVIASKLHELQGYDNYTPYRLIKIKEREYDYGCISPCFTSENEELVSAYGVVTSEKQRNDTSSYEHFIRVCGNHGMDVELLRRDMEYQFMTDFILSGTDRHLSNISILRDAETLKFIRMAPIYDSGKCLFVKDYIPLDIKNLLSIETTSFAKTELKLMSYITDRSLVDVSKLPSPSIIAELYLYDSKMDEKKIKLICEAYEKKIDIFRDFQLGKDLEKIKFSFQHPKTNIIKNNDYEWEL